MMEPASDRETIFTILERGEWHRHAELDSLCDGILARAPDDVLALYGSAFANMNGVSANKGALSAERLTRNRPSADSFWILGMNQVLLGLDGRMAFEKAAELDNKYWRHALLGKALEEKWETVEVAEFVFPLAVFSGQAIESTLYHIGGEFAEEEELLAIESHWLPECDILEIGALIGNHTAFFLKRLRPRRIDIFEMDKACLPYLEKTISLNNLGTECHIHLEEAGPGTQLAQADYFKIDIDGAEEKTIPALWPILKKFRGGLLEVSNENRFLKSITGEPAQVFDHGGYENWLLQVR